MTKLILIVLFSGALLPGGIIQPVHAKAEVSIGITIPLPGLRITAPPAMVVIPGTYAYFAPDVEADLFFYRGCWYRPYQGEWYYSVEYNGPWGRVAIGNVPPPLINLPPDYRDVPPGYERMPYPVVKKNWRHWEEERYWDTHGRRDEHAMPHGGRGMGRGMGMGGHGG